MEKDGMGWAVGLQPGAIMCHQGKVPISTYKLLTGMPQLLAFPKLRAGKQQLSWRNLGFQLLVDLPCDPAVLLQGYFKQFGKQGPETPDVFAKH